MSEICIVVLILSILLDAKLSITITSFGCVFSTTPFNISKVSIPVVPKTPGAIALTFLCFHLNIVAYILINVLLHLFRLLP